MADIENTVYTKSSELELVEPIIINIIGTQNEEGHMDVELNSTVNEDATIAMLVTVTCKALGMEEDEVLKHVELAVEGKSYAGLFS